MTIFLGLCHRVLERLCQRSQLLNLSFIDILRPLLRYLPGTKFCIFTKDTTSEDLPLFSTAYADGKIENEDDDYLLDELEDLRELQQAFLEKLAPKRYELIRLLVQHATNAVVGKNIKHQSQWTLHVGTPSPTELKQVKF